MLIFINIKCGVVKAPLFLPQHLKNWSTVGTLFPGKPHFPTAMSIN